MNLAFFGHHKCASTSISHLCFDVANDMGYRTIYKKTAFHENIEHSFNDGNHNFLISLNSKYEVINRFDEFIGFHLIRDPRDICVSGYFSHLYSHNLEGFDRLKPHREELKRLDFKEGLLKEFEFSDLWLKHILDWNYEDTRIAELKLEDLMLNPSKCLNSVFEKLEMNGKSNLLLFELAAKLNRIFNKLGWHNLKIQQKIPQTRLDALSNKYSFKNLSKGRKQGLEDKKSHYRKGVPGDWKNYFEKEHKEYFKDTYGESLVTLGYEKDLNW
tara:strand:- start:760 stop:1575 length:816 start_codon:yes stop_codon:yes gene_type:complete